mmetsp:Transcript_26236/g.86175  ORF Transcript_26236/g.86175 Transcript_26236/m.86175 type:complete len:319 (-) Transcript_26236:561-1517(-)
MLPLFEGSFGLVARRIDREGRAEEHLDPTEGADREAHLPGARARERHADPPPVPGRDDVRERSRIGGARDGHLAGEDEPPACVRSRGAKRSLRGSHRPFRDSEHFRPDKGELDRGRRLEHFHREHSAPPKHRAFFERRRRRKERQLLRLRAHERLELLRIEEGGEAVVHEDAWGVVESAFVLKRAQRDHPEGRSGHPRRGWEAAVRREKVALFAHRRERGADEGALADIGRPEHVHVAPAALAKDEAHRALESAAGASAHEVHPSAAQSAPSQLLLEPRNHIAVTHAFRHQIRLVRHENNRVAPNQVPHAVQEGSLKV